MSWSELSALLLSLSLLSCQELGFQEVTRFEMEAEIPVVFRLPEQEIPASPVELNIPIQASLELDLLETLRQEGRGDEAQALEENRDRILAVTLRKLEYEVSPNGIPADLGIVQLRMAPTESPDPFKEAWPLGSTIAIPAGRNIAARELLYEEGALLRAAPLLEALRFILVADTDLHLPTDAPVEPRRLLIRLRLKLDVLFNLLG